MQSGSPISQREIRRRKKALNPTSIGERLFTLVNGTFLVVLGLTMVYPFWSTVIVSFSNLEESTSLGFHIWIKDWDLTAYRIAMASYGNVRIGYMNSIFRVVVGTICTIVVLLLGAYPLSKKDLPFRNVLTIYILITMFFGGGLIPFYLLVRSLGLLDSRMVLILPTLVSGFSIIIVRNFLMTLDTAYEESAFMDGANYLQILVRIIVPLSKPVIAVVALWSTVGFWNEWFHALIFIRTPSKRVLQLILRQMLYQIGTLKEAADRDPALDTMGYEFPPQAVKAAVTMLTIGPIILVYPFLQKYFVKGIFVGSLKG